MSRMRIRGSCAISSNVLPWFVRNANSGTARELGLLLVKVARIISRQRIHEVQIVCIVSASTPGAGKQEPGPDSVKPSQQEDER